MLKDQAPPVTLREVARAAGVSTASASRALARGVVSTDLRRRILAAADRLGYVPNLAARSLAGRGSGLIGVMVNTLGDHLIAAAITALEQRLAESGYGVVIATAQGSPGQTRAALRGLLGRGVEALVLAEPAHGFDLGEAMRTRAVPWVALAEGAGQATVAMGRRRGAALAARFLLDLGHRRIGVLAPEGSGTAAGVADVLAGSRALWPPTATSPLPSQEFDVIQAAMQRLLNGDDTPTAVVCGSDLCAVAAVRECFARDIGVPRALSIIGFGDAEFARRAYPALTTVRVPVTRLGVRLAENLLASLERGVTPPAFDTPIKLVVRESTGPAPG